MKTLKKIFVFIVCIVAIIAISPILDLLSAGVVVSHQILYHGHAYKWISLYTYVLGVTEYQDFWIIALLGLSWFFPPLRKLYGRGFKRIGDIIYRVGDQLAYSKKIEKAKSLMTVDHMDE
jgi:hypothetical protein